ncbi:uncharacterized protein EDB91DRAFT_1236671 [Suillus paluster]|uniref:uncharacterized protein n=1 Tax=Suillus paluster TaxID=48578 RepID=UPI001B876C25|nr:uncharacterized protein EDB91DRAFT_1236671 [Suillus paluster]KAG1743664.1 hypothetical protein EDB91DRAFT_1236671 [Suillus paluster]
MGKKKQKLVHHTAEQLADTPSANIHTASMYTFQSGKPLVCMESLVGAHLAPTNLPPMTLLRNEDPPPAHNPWQIYEAGSFLDYMPIPGESNIETETSKRKRTAGRWNGNYFEQITLKSLGLRIQLGHRIGDMCCNPHCAFNDDFIIINSTGIHEVGLDFCACGTMQTHVKQLLHSRLFPATITDPKTAATFGVLEQYHLLSFESKASAFEFYQALSRLSNNTGMDPPKLLKHFAQGHCPDGIVTTEPRQCTVLCPACPHPGKNLLENWENTLLDKRWLYALFVGIDANFRLKQKLILSDIIDPGVSKGWSYFVEEKATCASHNTVNMADTKKSRGLAATGVGTVDCARHNMKLRNAVGDLQKGEKYVNMDYLFFLAMKHHNVIVLNISYNIACQWSKHLWSRMSKLPSAFHLDYNNKWPCQINFSFNFSQHVGHTDGEAPERGWANINPIASSTKEMGPGSRRDTFDDHFGDWNWKCVVQLANTVEQKANHQRKLLELESCLQTQDISEWRIDIEAWELDRMQPNPFKVRVALGTNISLHADVPPSVLISSAIDLEDQQYLAALSTHATDHQLTKVQQHANVLCRKIDVWQDIQLLYMPFVSHLRANEDCPRSPTDATPSVKAIDLWLPSGVGPDTQCSTQLHRFEWMLHYAQANNALKDIRNLLCLRSHLYKFKDNNIIGQAANTRARSTINKTNVKVSMAAERYEVARAALTTLAQILDEGPAWKDIFKPLNHNRDLKSLKDMWEKETEGTRHLLWIWKTPGEEVDLLKEEQRQVIAFLDWQAGWWWCQRQGCDSEHLDDCLREGLKAYAERQASLRRALSAHFQALWTMPTLPAATSINTAMFAV